MRKLFAIAFGGGILLFQAAEVVSPSAGWYWPFMDYPMYSASREAGEIFYENRYVVLPCDPGAARSVVEPEVMGVKFFDFQKLLHRAAAIQARWPTTPESREAAIAELNRLTAIRVEGDLCGAGVEVRRHRIAEEVGYREPPWQLERSWPLGPAGAAGTGSPRPSAGGDA